MSKSGHRTLYGDVFSRNDSKGQVMRTTFSFNLWRNIVILQVKLVVARITIALPRNIFQCCKLKKIVAKSRTWVYFVQHIAATYNTDICCVASWARGGDTGDNSYNVAP